MWGDGNDWLRMEKKLRGFEFMGEGNGRNSI
jgi:hypothetical protein